MWYGFWMTNRWLLLNFDALGAVVGYLNQQDNPLFNIYSLGSACYMSLLHQQPQEQCRSCRSVYYQRPQFHHLCLLGMSLLDWFGTGSQVSLSYIICFLKIKLPLARLNVLLNILTFLRSRLPLSKEAALLLIGRQVLLRTISYQSRTWSSNMRQNCLRFYKTCHLR